jgi:hypothetical protein
MRLGLAILVLAAPLLAGAAPGGAAPAAPAKTKAKEVGLDELRTRCYGGRGKPATELALGLWLQSASKASVEGNHERAVHWLKRALRGGADELDLIPSYIISAEQTENELSDETLSACNSLMDRLRRKKKD